MRPKRFREAIEGEGVGPFPYVDHITLGLTGVTVSTVRAIAYFRRELDDICIVANPAKTVVLPP